MLSCPKYFLTERSTRSSRRRRWPSWVATTAPSWCLVLETLSRPRLLMWGWWTRRRIWVTTMSWWPATVRWVENCWPITAQNYEIINQSHPWYYYVMNTILQVGDNPETDMGMEVDGDSHTMPYKPRKKREQVILTSDWLKLQNTYLWLVVFRVWHLLLVK